MKWVVLGGAGFIGCHFVMRLLDAKHDVLVVDNFSTGSKLNIPRSANVHVLEHDISEGYLYGLLHSEGWSDTAYVVNLACPASPPHYQADPLHTLHTCYQGTINALDLAYMCNARYIHASTSEVYGDPSEHPQTESYRGNVNTWGPRACYDEGKRVAETLCYEYQKLGTHVRVARIFNTYGPRMMFNDGRVVSNFIVQALRGEPITIYGDGSQTRSFCYVEDTVEGLLTLGRSEVTCRPVNIGNPEEHTVAKIAQTVLTLTSSVSKMEHRVLPVDDPVRRRPDITVAKNLGWEPKVSLVDGLKRTINDFKARLDQQGLDTTVVGS